MVYLVTQTLCIFALLAVGYMELTGKIRNPRQRIYGVFDIVLAIVNIGFMYTYVAVYGWQ